MNYDATLMWKCHSKRHTTALNLSCSIYMYPHMSVMVEAGNHITEHIKLIFRLSAIFRFLVVSDSVRVIEGVSVCYNQPVFHRIVLEFLRPLDCIYCTADHFRRLIFFSLFHLFEKRICLSKSLILLLDKIIIFHTSAHSLAEFVDHDECCYE